LIAKNPKGFAGDAVLSPEAALIYLPRGGRRVEIVDTHTGEKRHTLLMSDVKPLPTDRDTVALSGDGKVVGSVCTFGAAGGKVGETARFWKTDTYELSREIPVKRMRGGSGPLLSLSHDGRLAAFTHAYETSVIILEVETGKTITTLKTKACRRCDFLPDGRCILHDSTDARKPESTAFLIDIPPGERPRVSIEISKTPRILAVSPKDHQVALMLPDGSTRRKIEYFNSDTGASVSSPYLIPEEMLRGVPPIVGAALSGSNVAIAPPNANTIIVYDIWKRKELYRTELPRPPYALVMNADGSRLIATDGANTWLWALDDVEP
jgi:WD40 repeat protein